MPAPRPELEPEGLAVHLRPFAKKALLDYDAAPRAQDSDTDSVKIVNAKEFVGALHDACPELAFKRTVVRAALGIIVEEKNTSWGWSKSLCKDYIETNTNRIMNISRATSQGLQDKKRPEWVAKLPWMTSEVAPVPRPKWATFSVLKRPAAEISYVYDPSVDAVSRVE